MNELSLCPTNCHIWRAFWVTSWHTRSRTALGPQCHAMSVMQCVQPSCNGPLTRYVKLWFAHAPGMPGTFSPPQISKEIASQRSRHASRHVRHARAVMHVGIANPWWRGNVSDIPGAWATHNFTYLVRGPCTRTPLMLRLSYYWRTRSCIDCWCYGFLRRNHTKIKLDNPEQKYLLRHCYDNVNNKAPSSRTFARRLRNFVRGKCMGKRNTWGQWASTQRLVTWQLVRMSASGHTVTTSSWVIFGGRKRITGFF